MVYVLDEIEVWSLGW